jgi:hypothetical protein
MRKIDVNTISIRHAYAYSKSGSIFYSNLSNVKNPDSVDCYVQITGKYIDGGIFVKKIMGISLESFSKLKNIILDKSFD